MNEFVSYLFEKSKASQKYFIVNQGSEISFIELYEKISKNVRHLVSVAGTKKLIGICSANSPFFITSYLSVIQSGNVAVPFDVQLSPEEHSRLIKKHSIAAVLAENRYCSNLQEFLKEEIPVVTNIGDLPNLNDQLSSSKPYPQELAVVLFTSGSSGERKGVMLTHENLITNTNSIIQYLELSDQDRMNVVLPFSYSYGLSLLHTHLRVGGSFYLHQGPFVGSVLKEIEEQKCTGFAGVPSTFQILLNKTPFLKTKFSLLRYCTQAGGKLGENYIKELAIHLKGVKFYVMYGATEATARLSYLPPEMVQKKIGSIGKAIPGVELWLAGESGTPVGQNQIGEIVARGKNIMSGYLNNPAETNKVLKDGNYFTGDLAKQDEEGFFYIVGRKSSFIKSMGFKVSPYTIEKVLLEVPEIEQAVAMSGQDPLLGETVMVVIQVQAVCNKKELKLRLQKHCNERLASYEVPQRIEFVNAMPLTSVGKVDFVELKKMFYGN